MENYSNKYDLRSIGKRIREEREKFGLSREDFAEIVGLSDYYIGQIERGERQMSLPVLIKMAGLLRLSLDYLIFGENYYSAEHLRESLSDKQKQKADCLEEIVGLLKRCSKKELEMIKKLLKVILPYLNKFDSMP